MREILFRGKRIDNGEWVEGGIYSTNESELPWSGRELIECSVYIITNDDFKKSYCLGWYEGKFKEVVPKTVGQFTGLTDKNGTKIFEGDILSAHLDDGYPENITLLEVVWHNNGWYGKNEPFFDDFDNGFEKYFEVIGNAHDNPELLKE